MPEVDLTNCDREPIHIIGHAQPHGAILALDPANLTVVQASESVETHFGLSVGEVLGRSFLELLSGPDEGFTQALSAARLEGDPTHLVVGRVNDRGPFHLVAHLHDEVLVVEAEPVDERDGNDYQALPRRILRAFGATKTSQEFYESIVHEARVLTGFDRVMLYRFLEDGTGVVVAEATEPHLEPFLGLHYPASDVPQQARRLFALNTVRLYPEVDYRPSPIEPAVNPLTNRPLDLTYCALRGVSSMHTGYLQNMGVKASMALAITQGERLWGLVALHHCTPRALPYPLRATCELLAGLASLQVAEKETAGERDERERMRDVLDRLVERVQKEPQRALAVAEGEETILDLVPAGGAAFAVGGELRLLGETPGEPAVRALVEWLGEHQAEPLWAGEGFAAHYPPAREFPDVAAGILSAQISRGAKAYVLWFRPETARTVNWAGDPNKPVEASEFGDRLSPRRSFAVWKEEVAGLSRPWTEAEKGTAERLRLALVEALVVRADEILRLNAELERRNEDLDAFAHVAAHDLKEPLRGIRNYAQFLEEDQGERIDDEGREQIATILRLSARLESLLDSLLRFARVAREEMGAQRCDLGRAVEEAQMLMRSALERTKGRIVVHGPLPTVRGDQDLITEVFVNLFGNALKYNESEAPTVEVSAQEVSAGGTRVEVRDNGIGISERHFNSIFTLFRRLHAREAYGGGTGIGLTIVKKAMERLDGRVSVVSEPGRGATFVLEFPE